MKYAIIAKNTQRKFKRLPAGSKVIEFYLVAEPSNNEEGLSKKTFVKYSVNTKGEQVIEIFGNEEVTIVVQDYKIVKNGQETS